MKSDSQLFPCCKRFHDRKDAETTAVLGCYVLQCYCIVWLLYPIVPVLHCYCIGLLLHWSGTSLHIVPVLEYYCLFSMSSSSAYYSLKQWFQKCFTLPPLTFWLTSVATFKTFFFFCSFRSNVHTPPPPARSLLLLDLSKSSFLGLWGRGLWGRSGSLQFENQWFNSTPTYISTQVRKAAFYAIRHSSHRPRKTTLRRADIRGRFHVWFIGHILFWFFFQSIRDWHNQSVVQ